MKAKICELCRKEATIYCESDNAFLCWNCDDEVHGANFLVARHLRQPLCSSCTDFAEDSVSGFGILTNWRSPTCRNCSPAEDSFLSEDESDSDSDSDSSSICISSNESKPNRFVRLKNKTRTRVLYSSTVSEISSVETDSPATRLSTKKENYQGRPKSTTRFDAKAVGIFRKWCRDLGLNGNSAIPVVTSASNALRLCLEKTGKVFPFPVFLAASFWYGLKGNDSARASTCLSRIEQVSGVPAKLIVAVRLKFEREWIAQNSPRRDLVEGWAECMGWSVFTEILNPPVDSPFFNFFFIFFK